MRKVISLLMVCVMLACCTVMATAVSVSPSDVNETREAQKIARVKAEVLSGNITNEQDVIEVALAQYAEKVAYCRANGIALDPNESLTITQVIESDVSVAGSDSVRVVAGTSLLLLDEDGNEVSAASAVTRSGSNSVYSSELDIYAYITLYAQVKVEGGVTYYRASQITSSISDYVPAGTVLTQFFLYPSAESPYSNTKVVSNPTDGVNYNFYPGDPWHAYVGMNHNLLAWCTVSYGGDQVLAGIQYDPDGIDEYPKFYDFYGPV